MKTLIIYYSLDGNTRMISELIKSNIESDILELVPVHDNNKKGLLKILSGGKQVLRKEKPELKPFNINPGEYDLIFIGTPVWAGTFSPALNTFLSDTLIKDKKIVLFCCNRGGKGKVFEKFRELLKNNLIISEKDFTSPLKKNRNEISEDVKTWIDDLLKTLD
jgi:flavodoxin